MIKSKKVQTLLVIVFIILMIILVLLLNDRQNKQKENNYVIVNNASTFFTIASCANRYIEYVASKNIDNISMDILSMGMSDDYEEAIRCGANMIRVGSALFGARYYPT